MNTARKGRRVEHKVRAVLQDEGFAVVRAAASKGVVDLVAWNSERVRLIQVKSNARPSPAERETLRAIARPANATVECWRWPDYWRAPIIECLS
jgi:Holliday junction resolvase